MANQNRGGKPHKGFSREQDIAKVKEIEAKVKAGTATKGELELLKKLARKYGVTGQDMGPGNDFSFWNKYPVLVKDAANVNWQYIPGTGLELQDGSLVRVATGMVVQFASLPGVSTVGTAAINLQIRNLWLDMHRKFRGIGSYQSADLGMAIVAIADLFGNIAESERLYGLARTYTATNRAMPKNIAIELVSSLAFESICDHLADFRYGINRLIEKASQLCLPKGLSFISDRASLSGYVYADSKNYRATPLAFTSKYATFYRPTMLTTGGALAYHQSVRFTASTYDMILREIEDQMDILLTDSDVVRMCSDVLAAYKDSGIERLSPMPEDYRIEMTYEESIIRKFHNMEMTILDVGNENQNYLGTVNESSNHFDAASINGINTEFANDFDCFFIYQYNDVIYSCPAYTAGGHSKFEDVAQTMEVFGAGIDPTQESVAIAPPNAHVLDSWEEEPSLETTFESILWKQVCGGIVLDDSGTKKLVARVKSCSTIIPLSIKGFAGVFGTNRENRYYGLTMEYNSNNYNELYAASQFDWFPVTMLVNTWCSIDANDQCVTPTLYGLVYGDLDHCTSVSDVTVKRVHDAAILSAFKFDDAAVTE